MKKRKIIIITTIIFVFLMALVGCNNVKQTETKGIESGFSLSSGEPVPPEMIGFSAEVREFYIDNVELKIFVGWRDSNLDALNDPIECEIICYNNNNKDCEIILKRIDNFNDRKYVCIYNSETNRFEYSYGEMMRIPADLFSGDSGEIVITTKFPTSIENHQYGACDSFLYKKIGESQVRIDEWWTKYTEVES